MPAAIPGPFQNHAVMIAAIITSTVASAWQPASADDCRTGAGTSITAGPPVAEGDVMHVAVTISVPHVGDICAVLLQSLRVWLPDQPAKSSDPCEQAGGIEVSINGNIQLQPGEFVRIACVDSDMPNCIEPGDVNCELLADEMCYVADPNDAIAGSLLFAACWSGIVVGDGYQIDNGLHTSTTLINPQISLTCTPSATSPCSGQPSIVTIDYHVSTGQGDVAITSIELTDSACSPISRGPDSPGNNNAILELGEVWTYHCVATLDIPLLNTVTATGADVVTGHVVSDSELVVVAADCIADLDCDSVVGSGDLAVLLANWGLCPVAGVCIDDLWSEASDGLVGAAELGAVLANWGPCR